MRLPPLIPPYSSVHCANFSVLLQNCPGLALYNRYQAIPMLRGTVENIPKPRSRSRGAQAKTMGSPHAARVFPEGSPNMSIHSPYARMESSDPLKRKQTILSLIDMLSELSGDNGIEPGSFSFSLIAASRVERFLQMSPRRQWWKRTCVSHGGLCNAQRA